jgi:hypothetical protein
MRPDRALKGIARGGVLGTSSTTADQVIVTFTPTLDFYLESVVANVYAEQFPGGDGGRMYLESPAGTRLREIPVSDVGRGGQSVAGPSAAPKPGLYASQNYETLASTGATVIPGGTEIRIVVTPITDRYLEFTAALRGFELL